VEGAFGACKDFTAQLLDVHGNFQVLSILNHVVLIRPVGEP
jgi:hypothetical protein